MSNSNMNQCVRAIRGLHEDLFKNYSSEMKRLNAELVSSKDKFKQVERRMNRRYLELVDAVLFSTCNPQGPRSRENREKEE